MTFQRWFFIGLSTLVLALSACQSKQKSEDSSGMAPDATSSEAPPVIEDKAMTFDAQGSDSGKISGLKSVHFEYDKSSLSAEAKKALAGNAEWMKSHGSSNLTIEGHADLRGSNEYNLALGERRARAVKAYLQTLGVANSKMNTVSYGKERPLAQGESESDHYKNRRANFVPN